MVTLDLSGFSWQLFASKGFCIKIRLCNIFKTAKAIALTGTILESTYAVVQSSRKRTTLKILV